MTNCLFFFVSKWWLISRCFPGFSFSRDDKRSLSNNQNIKSYQRHSLCTHTHKKKRNRINVCQLLQRCRVKWTNKNQIKMKSKANYDDSKIKQTRNKHKQNNFPFFDYDRLHSDNKWNTFFRFHILFVCLFMFANCCKVFLSLRQTN